MPAWCDEKWKLRRWQQEQATSDVEDLIEELESE